MCSDFSSSMLPLKRVPGSTGFCEMLHVWIVYGLLKNLCFIISFQYLFAWLPCLIPAALQAVPQVGFLSQSRGQSHQGGARGHSSLRGTCPMWTCLKLATPAWSHTFSWCFSWHHEGMCQVNGQAPLPAHVPCLVPAPDKRDTRGSFSKFSSGWPSHFPKCVSPSQNLSWVLLAQHNPCWDNFGRPNL